METKILWFASASKLRALIAMTAINLVVPSWAYEVETHAAMSSFAAEQAVLLTGGLVRLGLRPLRIDDKRQMFVSSEGQALSITDLIQFGSRWEDELGPFQAFRHFYDPANDRPLDLGGTGSTFIAKSPDWALEDSSTFLSQAYSYKRARNYLYKALTETSGLDRRKYFGLTFQSIGQVIHHLQDMAQPQHVRNDPHCDDWKCSVAASVSGNALLYAPSQYEKYTDLDSPNDPLRQIRSKLPYLGVGSTPVYPPSNTGNNPLKKPRDFWRTTAAGSDIAPGKGISEYTNRNFFSAGTISSTYSSPHSPAFSEWYSPSEVVNIQTLLPGTSLTGTVHFFATQVTDALSDTSVENKRALSDALLDGDLAQIYSSTGNGGYLVFTLNRFTYDAAHQFLIPRAVAYSAGLINYFFRGQLEITPPDEGVYGIIDHTIENQPNLDGFRKVKLKIKNVSPGGTDSGGRPVTEPIPNGSPGTLLAIAKFHRNNCYHSDLGGEYGSPGIDWQSCRASSEEIVVSQPQAVPAGINQDPTPVSFDFPNPIPINATDLYLQVVYRGPLGEEPDAIAVATKDISEPTYVYVFNTWDQYLYCVNGIISADPPCAEIYTFKESFCDQLQPQLTYEQCRAHGGQTLKFRSNPIANPVPGYDPANPAVPQEALFDISRESPFVPVGSLPTPIGSFTRVAMLLDFDPPANPYLIVAELGAGAMASQFQWWQAPSFVPTVNQFDPTTDAMVTSRHYARARGVYVETTPYVWNPAISDYYLLSSGTATSIPPLVLIPSQINF
jgi:hypothetical protein